VHPVVLVLDNLRSAFNVGSIFRSAETAGVAEVVTLGITPHPPHPKLRKTAMSAVDHVPTRHFDDARAGLAYLKTRGYTSGTALSIYHPQELSPAQIDMTFLFSLPCDA
jgi:tRNA G18 (ribose-2'-O)-methylase SpoU